MNRLLIISIFVLISLFSCNKDDDGVTEISIEEQNTQDDGSIQTFLQEYYFDDLGRIKAFDEEDASDDEETPLIDMAQALNDGVYYVINPDVEASGAAITNVDTQKLLMHYDFKTFYSSRNEDSYEVSSLGSAFNTINTTGLPTWNVAFYRKDLDEDSNYDESYYEMPGFKEAITHFHATDRSLEDPYIFQGVIIVPSRANYARNANYYGLYNQIAVISFEVYQVQDDE